MPRRKGPKMVIYSEIPSRGFRQFLGDLWLVAWSAASVWIALKIHDLVMNLAAPGLALVSGANSLAGSMTDAGDKVGSVPLLGGALAQPFEAMSSAAGFIASAGQAQVDAVSALATFLQWAIIVLAILPLASLWIPMRLAFIRRASAARRFVDANADLDLFALRAMARQPLHLLARIDDDPAGAWRRGDLHVIGQLAALELKAEGIRPSRVLG